jgi:hypothetical protein
MISIYIYMHVNAYIYIYIYIWTCVCLKLLSLVTSGPWHPAVKLREDPLGGGIFSALLAGGHDGVVGHDLR